MGIAVPVDAWNCDACGQGDNATRFHSPWTVTVSGERGVQDEPEVGEHGDYLELELEFCDRCAGSPDVVVRALSAALEVERHLTRCPVCTHELDDKGRCESCDSHG